MNWNDFIEDLRQRRSALEESKDAPAWEDFFQSVRPHFPEVKSQLLRYLRRLCDTNTTKDKDTKTLVKDTRNTLRFGLSCLSIPCDNIRIAAQDEALRCDWDDCEQEPKPPLGRRFSRTSCPSALFTKRVRAPYN